MGVHVLTDGDDAVLYCSTSEVAFGPVFHGGEVAAEDFLRYVRQEHGTDVRSLSDVALQLAFSAWLVDPKRPVEVDE